MARSTQPPPSGHHPTVDEVCHELSISRSTFYDWKAKGRAPRCYKLPNGDLRTRRCDLDDWFAALEVEVA